MICEVCQTKLTLNRKEYFCPGCGLVVEYEDYPIQIRDFDQFGHGIPVYAHEANDQQTEKLILWRNGRMIIKVPKKMWVRNN